MRASANGKNQATATGARPARRPITVVRSAQEPVMPGYARHIGRVGALAVSLGIGAAIVAMPVVYADTRGSGGSTGSSDSS